VIPIGEAVVGPELKTGIAKPDLERISLVELKDRSRITVVNKDTA